MSRRLMGRSVRRCFTRGGSVAVLAMAVAVVLGGCSLCGPATPEQAKLTDPFRDDFNPGWEARQTDWRVATWMQNGTQMSPERCKTDGKGFLVQTVLAGEPFRGGSLQTDREFSYGRWVARVKPSPVPGVLNSVFTVDWDDLTTPEDEHDGTKFEVDIEFLTYTFGPASGEVHLAVHVAGRKNAFVDDVKLDFNPSDEFREWGFDILPDKIVWHVDGKPLRTFDRPDDITWGPAYEFFFNSWTAGPDSWIKGPAKTDANYYIDWVQFTPMEQMD